MQIKSFCSTAISVTAATLLLAADESDGCEGKEDPENILSVQVHHGKILFSILHRLFSMTDVLRRWDEYMLLNRSHIVLSGEIK